MNSLEALKAALEQQRKYERENWPFENGEKPPVMGEDISYHLASLLRVRRRCFVG